MTKARLQEWVFKNPKYIEYLGENKSYCAWEGMHMVELPHGPTMQAHKFLHSFHDFFFFLSPLSIGFLCAFEYVWSYNVCYEDEQIKLFPGMSFLKCAPFFNNGGSIVLLRCLWRYGTTGSTSLKMCCLVQLKQTYQRCGKFSSSLLIVNFFLGAS